MSDPSRVPGRLAALPALAAAALVAAAIGTTPAAAQISGGLTGADGEPIVIEADRGIEWRQKEKVYVARGNAKAVQGETTVAAETLTAHYREAEGGDADIWKVVASGGVTITSGDRVLSGDLGVYNVETGVFTLTGGPLKLETPKETVTASERLEYRSQQQIAEVVGDAVATQADKTVRADTFVAAFQEGPDGELELSQVDALGNVIITTATEIATADRGVYNASTGIATLDGDVKLTRGENQLNGEYAEVNLNTGVSRLLGSAEGGRVHGLFIPRNLEEMEQQDGDELGGTGQN